MYRNVRTATNRLEELTPVTNGEPLLPIANRRRWGGVQTRQACVKNKILHFAERKTIFRRTLRLGKRRDNFQYQDIPTIAISGAGNLLYFAENEG